MVAPVLAFVAVSALVIVTPGQDTALTIRNTLLGGRTAGVGTACGVALAQNVWALATSIGLAAVLAASEPAFIAVKLAGAAYLVVLGVQSLLAACGRRAPGHAVTAAPGRTLQPRRAFRQGFLSNLGNPKMAVFFTSMLPQFASSDDSFVVLLALGLAFSAMTLAWLCAYAVAVARARHVLGRPRVRRALDAIAGIALVGLGVRLASESR